MVVALTEIVPATVRTAGFLLAYSLATTLGGSSLAISTFLIARASDYGGTRLLDEFCGALRANRDARALPRPGSKE